VVATPLTVRYMLLGIPALVLVLGAVLLTMVALFFGGDRRDYALLCVDGLTGMARVLVGLPPPGSEHAIRPNRRR
jgi:hypothetical protein